MSLQYTAGPIINTTFTSDGTRQNLVDQLSAALASAGWTYVSGSGTADVMMRTQTSQGLRIRFRLFAPASGNCAQFTMKNDPNTLTSNIAYMLPTNGKVFRVITSPTWFFMFSSGTANSNAAREVMMGGTIWVPDFVLTNMGADLNVGWFIYTGTSDTNTGANESFRTRMFMSNVNAGLCSSLWAGAMDNSTPGASGASPALAVPLCGNSGSTSWSTFLWVDGTVQIVEPVIGWGRNSGTPAQAFRLKGMLWDALVHTGTVDGESTMVFDGHTWMAITNQSGIIPIGTLCVRIV